MDIDDSDSIDNGFGGVSSDEDNDEPRVRNVSVRTGVLDEKAAATQAIGLFALHTKSVYAPYPTYSTIFLAYTLYTIHATVWFL